MIRPKTFPDMRGLARLVHGAPPTADGAVLAGPLRSRTRRNAARRRRRQSEQLRKRGADKRAENTEKEGP